MGAHNPYDNFPEIHRGRSFSKDFERIDTLKMGDKILVEDARTGRVMYCYVNQLKEIDPEFGEYLKTASISEDGSTLTLTKSDGTQIVFHGGSGSAEGAVRFDEVQTLTEAQKGVARGNIGAISSQQMSAAILAESQRAKDAEEGLRGNIQAEIERAMQTETGLSNNILAEQTRAENAESALSARIDTIIQGRNVRDIVGNYDELLAYDTSTLGDNDIVMMLLDATKSGHTTYYRWKEAEGEWEFIGGLAFTYTKTEIDDKFAALHIVLPTIPADAVEHPEEYQELLAQVDSMVRSAGSDASFKMPISNVGNVDITFVKTNPAHLYLGIFADDKSILYTINRTTSTPREYTCEIVEKVFVTGNEASDLANDAITDALDEDNYGVIIGAIKAHHDTTKQDKNKMQSVITESSTNYPSSQAVVDYAAKKSKLTELSLKVGKFSEITPTLSSGVQIATLKKEVEGQEVETPLYAPQGGGGFADWEKLIDHTTTAESTALIFQSGEQGQVLDDYKEIMIMALLQPVPEGSTERRFRLSFASSNPWAGKYFTSVGNPEQLPLATEKSRTLISSFVKTPCGIIETMRFVSSNNATISNYLMMQTGFGLITKLGANVIISPDDFTMPLLDEHYNCIAIGGFGTTKFSPNTKIIVYGKK